MDQILFCKSLISGLITFLVFLTLSSRVQCRRECPGKENSYLWKIDVSPPVYLFGTLHIPYTTLWDSIPENAKTAFSSSEELCLELKLLDPKTASELSNCKMLPSGESLEDRLSLETIGRIQSYLDKIQQLFPRWMGSSGGAGSLLNGGRTGEQLFNALVGNWRKMRPIWVLYLIGSLTEKNIQLQRTPVVDVFLERAAKGLGKHVQAIETPDDQCKPFNKLTNEQVEMALKVQLDYLEVLVESPDFNGIESTMEEDIYSYRCGDFTHTINHTPILPIPSLDNITATSPFLSEKDIDLIRGTEIYLHRQLVIKRNRKMMQKITSLLQSQRNKTFFLGIGAGHYLSEKNVLNRLTKRGYKIVNIPANQPLNGSSLPKNIIELGDPESVPRLLQPIVPITEPRKPTGSSSGSRERLSPDLVDSIFNKYWSSSPSSPPSPTSATPDLRSRVPRSLSESDTVSVPDGIDKDLSNSAKS